MKKTIITVQCLAVFLYTNTYSNKNYVLWCQSNKCDPWVQNTKIEPLNTNHYTVCCGLPQTGECGQPTATSLKSNSTDLAVTNVGYCGESSSNGGLQFSVTNINPFGKNVGFDISPVTCDPNNPGSPNGMDLSHHGFSSTSYWPNQYESSFGLVCTNR